MTGAIIATAIAIAGMVFAGVVLGRQTKNRKQEAIESLKAERDAIASVNIFDLVNAEVTDLGLREIDGGETLPPDVLLKVFKDSEHGSCPKSSLHYVVADGVDPTHADLDQVTITCDDD